MSETLTMHLDESREHFEELLLRVSAEVIGETADYRLEPHDKRPTQARVRFTSRLVPDRSAGVALDSAWLEAFFFIEPNGLEPNVSLFKLDDFDDDEEYTAGEVRELVSVVHAFLQGEGSIESRRTVLGRRRPQIRFNVDGHEWLAKTALFARK